MRKGKPFLDEPRKLAALGKWVSMVELAEPHADDVVLDLGTGTGNTAIYLAPKVAKVVAVDNMPEHLVAAKEKARKSEIDNIEFVEFEIDGDLSRWVDGSFSLVCCRAALHHLRHRNRVFEEVRRLLNPGGRLNIMDPIVSEPFRLFWTPISRMGESDHVSYVTYFELMSLFERYGLPVQEMVPFRLERDLEEWLSRFMKIDDSGALKEKALGLITEFLPSELQGEVGLHTDEDGRWRFSYHCVEVVGMKPNK